MDALENCDASDEDGLLELRTVDGEELLEVDRVDELALYCVWLVELYAGSEAGVLGVEYEEVKVVELSVTGDAPEL